ncbi:hypothetical protein [Yersinia similis]|uniref:hypothetical protein n=1 Tax=Yersinia similis TaxID=367190 RepID=UPI0011A70AE9|nr:hypothetical protein [Yersinia similis]
MKQILITFNDYGTTFSENRYIQKKDDIDRIIKSLFDDNCRATDPKAKLPLNKIYLHVTNENLNIGDLFQQLKEKLMNDESLKKKGIKIIDPISQSDNPPSDTIFISCL